MSRTHQRILVVTPTLGDSVFLDRTVASVAAQPVDLIHVIATPAPRVAELQARFPRTRVVADAGRAGGIYGALNAGLAAAGDEWDWFTYINDDDTLLPGFSSAFFHQVIADFPEAVVYGDVDLLDENDRVLSQVTVERTPAWIPALLQEGISPLMQQGMLFRRQLVGRLGGFDLRYRLCADLDFWLRAYVMRAGFRYFPVRIAQFRLRGGQLSGNTATTEREQEEIVRRHLPEPVSRFRRRLARWRYRWCNLPRYLERVRTRGWRTSYQLLQGEGVRQ
ncbi:MAG TPA: glycosyltransferase [Opitutaceae bacterium]|nr:glycosyltransferase [Opitutaceae bacterium]